ncbi:DUF488 domain-containing protein [Desulfitobacterium sp. THU1]|uniref:DUF488 domain-containing protein n=1 Tax=Desulfitobacterium sp. THU1 TaxID=3138072 RepID=UPI00311D47D6
MFTVYTIGHSTHSHEQLLKLLKEKDINCVVDVRSVPYSRYANLYNREVLKAFLNTNKIIYLFMGKELGARQASPLLYTPEGYLDFEKTSKSDVFRSGIKRVLVGLEKNYIIALMCTEKDPIDCHRAILVGKELKEVGCSVRHILEDGKIETQEELEMRMINTCFPDWRQLSLFAEQDSILQKDELIIKAYRQKNTEIGYKQESEQEEVTNA